MTEPAIVVIAYNRVLPLQRLLQSLANASYPSENIKLHISIDASVVKSVKQLADSFEWTHGEKIVDLKSENLGLVKHVMECGQLTKKYGSIIVLEDDLIVAPGFYRYAQKANEFYSKDDQIAGVSLFTYPVEENNFYPFEPIHDGTDVHFIQVASSWGQSWSSDQWSKFKTWLIDNPNGKSELLPTYIQNWGNKSWKRLFISYLIDTDRYFVFPNTAYSSNFEEDGTHASDKGLFQVNMHVGITDPRFESLEDSNSIHDAYFELLPKCVKNLYPSLSSVDFEVDMYGEKPVEGNSEYVLTSKRSKKAISSYASRMRPLLQNVLNEIEGEDIVLCRREDLTLTEKNRFLMLHASSMELDQFTKVIKQKREQVSLIIPVLDDQVDAFKTTLNSLKSDHFCDVSLLIVCSEETADRIDERTKHAPLRIEIVICPIQNVDDLLRIGIANCVTDYCGWAQPGMLIDLNRLESVSKIFQRMSLVQIVHGVEEDIVEESYAKLNTSKGRWTTARANSNQSEATKIRTEFVFWRKSLLTKEVISKIGSANLFVELLKLNPIYLAALKLGDLAGVNPSEVLSTEDVSEILSGPEYQPKGGVTAIFRPIFQFWFNLNVPFFRLFYKESEQLPLVIRYDFKNDSFYLDNY
jgi:hypothetical protein